MAGIKNLVADTVHSLSSYWTLLKLIHVSRL